MKKITALLQDPWREYLLTNHHKGCRLELDAIPTYNLDHVPGNVLDISGGSGNEAYYLQQFFSNRSVIVTESSPTALQLLQTQPKLHIVNANFEDLASTTLIKNNGPYAYIQALYALPFASKKEILNIILKSIASLSKGGVFIFNLYHKSYPHMDELKALHDDHDVRNFTKDIASKIEGIHQIDLEAYSYFATPQRSNARQTYVLTIRKR